MKEFILEKAKAGNAVCTREGNAVQIVSFDGDSDKPIVVFIKDKDGKIYGTKYTEDGKWNNDKSESKDDLMMKH